MNIPKAKPKPFEEVVHSLLGEKVRSKMLYIPKTAILIDHMISFHDWPEPLGLRRDTTMPMAIKWRGRWWTTLNNHEFLGIHSPYIYKQAHEWLLIIQPWLLEQHLISAGALNKLWQRRSNVRFYQPVTHVTSCNVGVGVILSPLDPSWIHRFTTVHLG